MKGCIVVNDEFRLYRVSCDDDDSYNEFRLYRVSCDDDDSYIEAPSVECAIEAWRNRICGPSMAGIEPDEVELLDSGPVIRWAPFCNSVGKTADALEHEQRWHALREANKRICTLEVVSGKHEQRLGLIEAQAAADCSRGSGCLPLDAIRDRISEVESFKVTMIDRSDAESQARLELVQCISSLEKASSDILARLERLEGRML